MVYLQIFSIDEHKVVSLLGALIIHLQKVWKHIEVLFKLLHLFLQVILEDNPIGSAIADDGANTLVVLGCDEETEVVVAILCAERGEC